MSGRNDFIGRMARDRRMGVNPHARHSQTGRKTPKGKPVILDEATEDAINLRRSVKAMVCRPRKGVKVTLPKITMPDVDD